MNQEGRDDRDYWDGKYWSECECDTCAGHYDDDDDNTEEEE